MLGGQRFRVTAQHGKIIGIEMWTAQAPANECASDPSVAYGYIIWKA